MCGSRRPQGPETAALASRQHELSAVADADEAEFAVWGETESQVTGAALGGLVLTVNVTQLSSCDLRYQFSS